MATYQITALEQMNCIGDVSNNWKNFREGYEDYLVATGLNQKDKKVQVITLKSLMGNERKKILKRLLLTEGEMKEPVIILQKLEDHFVQERNAFHNTEQQVRESIDQFVIKLRQLAEPCHFGALEDEMVRDRLVLGCKDNAARTRLFRKKDCTLKKAIESLHISEATSEQLKKIEREDKKNPKRLKISKSTKKGHHGSF